MNYSINRLYLYIHCAYIYSITSINTIYTVHVGNECLMQLSSCLLSYFAGFCPELIQYIMRQFDFQDLPSNEHSLSLVKLVLQVFNRK